MLDLSKFIDYPIYVKITAFVWLLITLYLGGVLLFMIPKKANSSEAIKTDFTNGVVKMGKTNTVKETENKLTVGEDSVVMGKVPPNTNVGNGSVVIGATDDKGNTIINTPMAVGRNAHVGTGSIAIGANSGADMKREPSATTGKTFIGKKVTVSIGGEPPKANPNEIVGESTSVHIPTSEIGKYDSIIGVESTVIVGGDKDK